MVKLVKHKKNGTAHAVKVMSKAQVGDWLPDALVGLPEQLVGPGLGPGHGRACELSPI